MAIDFSLSPEQLTLQRDSHEFAHQHLRGVASAFSHLPTPGERYLATRPIYQEVVRAGFLRRMIPRPFGGEGNGLIDMAIVTEEFHAVDANITLTLLANLLGLMPVFLGGSPEQIKHFVQPFLETHGTPIASLCNSEPGGSANYGAPAPAVGVRTTAEIESDEWVINGEKKWMNAGGWDGAGADLLCVVCRTDPTAPPSSSISLIAVEKPTQGFELIELLDTMGNRAHPAPRFRLNDVRVPKGNLIGSEGQGKDIVDASFTSTAALVGIMGVGLMRAAFEFALDFARTEKRGGAKPIIEHQAVGYALADAKATLEAARYLAWSACDALDRQSPGAPELALHSKIFGSEASVQVITKLMGVVGIDSYDHELPLAGLLQDALVLPLFDGGNMGVRRRQMHEMIMEPDYDPRAASTTWSPSRA
jgi:alkylation response protein AidB-like acyl-CoA dehydrogenase